MLSPHEEQYENEAYEEGWAIHVQPPLNPIDLLCPNMSVDGTVRKFAFHARKAELLCSKTEPPVTAAASVGLVQHIVVTDDYWAGRRLVVLLALGKEPYEPMQWPTYPDIDFNNHYKGG